MHNLLDDRFREPKKKIFPQQNRGSMLVNQSSIQGKSSYQSVPSCILQQVEDLKKQISELHNSNVELKSLLKEERQRYDSLFEEYQELMQRNSLIEKEYINLKYEHNREIKDIKKGFIDQIYRQKETIITQIESIMKEEDVHQKSKEKLDKIIQTLKVMPQFRDKISKHHSKRTIQICQEKHKQSSEISSKQQSEIGKGPQTEDIEICFLANTTQRQEKSPQKEMVAVVLDSNEHLEKEILIFEDEYYGQLQDYNAFEEKVTIRRNYELMRKNNRSSTEIKRKKIFNP